MLKKLLYLLSLILFWSCNEEDEVIIPVESNSFTAYPKGYFITTLGGRDTIKLEYQNNQVTKRIGEWMELAGSTGYGNKFSKLLETHIAYSGNEAILTKFSKREDVIVSKDFQRYRLNGKQISEAIFTYQNKPDYIEKYVYTYENNQLNHIDLFVTDGYYTNDLRSRRDFYFSTNGNLDSLVYRDAVHDYDKIILPYIDYKDKMRKVMIFSDYDQSQNPFQNLSMFTDLYYKSLSKNNFRKIETLEYDKEGQPSLGISLSMWNYEYVNGEIKVLK
ncbi:hypothetical protein [Empedobacter brevis]|uniref:hypothetical protein n=1 Tax=Empedobacter brevis TaxID=247 RepID=UPI00289F7616|nr:hypothetical protein [Empedobacter brevis]